MSEKIQVTSEPEGPNKVAELHVRINGRAIPVKHLRSFSLRAETPSTVPVLVIQFGEDGVRTTNEYLIESFTLDAVTKVVPE